MPEMRFTIAWPDGATESCYSPSLVIKEYFVPGETLKLSEFVDRSRTALAIASDRVKARYGFACSLAQGQIARIETTAARYATQDDATVTVVAFED